MLTIEKLKTLHSGEIFSTGITFNERLWTDGAIRWVAVRGEGWHDWAIYYDKGFHTPEQVAISGEKIISEDIIQSLVPCDKETMKLYRL